MTTTMTCICGTEHTFPEGVGTGECEGCGLGLVLSEELDEPSTRVCCACRGSGIGRTGDPDTSRCTVCHGHGEVAEDGDEFEEDAEDYDDDDHYDEPDVSDEGFDPYLNTYTDDC